MDTLQKESQVIKKTMIWNMILNFFLMVMKITAGIIGSSTAIISDAVNSAGDVGTAFFVMIAGKFSRKEHDKEHPYGHEKFESMASLLLGVAMIVTAFEIGKASVTTMIDYLANGVPIKQPTVIALIGAIMTIIVKEVMFQATNRASKKASAPSLHAMAMDHRSDQLSALGVVIGIGGAMLGIVILEPIASLIICLMIFSVAISIIRTGITQVVDQAATPDVVEAIRNVALSEDGVMAVDDLKTRIFGAKIYVDIEIAVNPNLSVCEAHDIAEKVHDHIELEMPNIKHCMVHVNPFDEN